MADITTPWADIVRAALWSLRTLRSDSHDLFDYLVVFYFITDLKGVCAWGPWRPIALGVAREIYWFLETATTRINVPIRMHADSYAVECPLLSIVIDMRIDEDLVALITPYYHTPRTSFPEEEGVTYVGVPTYRFHM